MKAERKMKNIKYKVCKDLFSIIPATIVLLVFGGVTVWLDKTNNGMFIFTGLLTAIVGFLWVCILYQYFFKKILVGENGFYYQDGIFSGKYYKYEDIMEAWESKGITTNGVLNYYLNLKTTDGKVMKYNFTVDKIEGVLYLIDKVTERKENANE